ncbi:hypothetical protein WN51_06115 [Melipona quadrifasciata]|uniref:Uncharacterized protein n=1 Tax=Melipona quadrifasciata TaxID=166423 RepID=A0A0N0U346_9HYME|nr:hypothetical protein WN51_06115 [Melipona quadrifasciata]
MAETLSTQRRDRCSGGDGASDREYGEGRKDRQLATSDFRRCVKSIDKTVFYFESGVSYSNEKWRNQFTLRKCNKCISEITSKSKSRWTNISI